MSVDVGPRSALPIQVSVWVGEVPCLLLSMDGATLRPLSLSLDDAEGTGRAVLRALAGADGVMQAVMTREGGGL